MTMIWVEWTGLGLVALVVVSYWLYTLVGMKFVEPLIQSPVRRFVVFMGVMAASASLALEALQSVVALPTESLVPTLGAVILAAYAIRKQWLIPEEAPRYEPCSQVLPPETLVAVLSDGSAIPVCWLSIHRTVRVGTTLVVHCGIARSLTAYSGADIPLEVAALLPHSSGFVIGTSRHRWDGVDGKSVGSNENLHRVPITLCRADAWQGGVASKVLYGPAGKSPAIHNKVRTPHVPGARGVEDAHQWGRVHFDQRWEALEDHDYRSCETEQPLGDSPSAFFLSRWAAVERGYVIEDGPEPDQTEHPELGTP